MSNNTKHPKPITSAEKAIIRALNFCATFDGAMTDSDIVYMLEQGIARFIPKSRRHLVEVSDTAYPIQIKYTQQ